MTNQQNTEENFFKRTLASALAKWDELSQYHFHIYICLIIIVVGLISIGAYSQIKKRDKDEQSKALAAVKQAKQDAKDAENSITGMVKNTYIWISESIKAHPVAVATYLLTSVIATKFLTTAIYAVPCTSSVTTANVQSNIGQWLHNYLDANDPNNDMVGKKAYVASKAAVQGKSGPITTDQSNSGATVDHNALDTDVKNGIDKAIAQYVLDGSAVKELTVANPDATAVTNNDDITGWTSDNVTITQANMQKMVDAYKAHQFISSISKTGTDEYTIYYYGAPKSDLYVHYYLGVKCTKDWQNWAVDFGLVLFAPGQIDNVLDFIVHQLQSLFEWVEEQDINKYRTFYPISTN